MNVCQLGGAGSSYHLHEALATLRGDDSQVRLAAVHDLGARGRRRRLGRNYFPQTAAVGGGEEARRGPGTVVSVSWTRGRSKEGLRQWTVHENPTKHRADVSRAGGK